jgi:hypothetical protein
MRIERLDIYVRKKFGMDLYAFLKRKLEEDALHDYQIASMLNVGPWLIWKLRRGFEIKRANGLPKRF